MVTARPHLGLGEEFSGWQSMWAEEQGCIHGQASKSRRRSGVSRLEFIRLLDHRICSLLNYTQMLPTEINI